MTNNKKSFYTILALSAPRLMKDSYNVIASSHYLGTMGDNFTSSILAKRLEMVYDGNLKIVIISNDITEYSSSNIGDSISSDFLIFNFPADLFFSTDNIEKVLIKNKNINQCIFIFKDRDYGQIVSNLALFNIIISGGSNTKKHILSPIQLRLARFLIAILPLTGSNVVNSFHSYRKDKNACFDYTTKEAKEEISQYIEHKLKEAELKDTDSTEAMLATSQESPKKTQSLLDKGNK